MKPFLILKSVDEVLAEIDKLPCLPPISKNLDEACGLRLAEDFFAPFDLPGFDRSTVEGYAARARDLFGASENSPAMLNCVGDCPMGRECGLCLEEGQAAGILTGGALPAGADCAVMIEYTRAASDGTIEVIRAAAPGGNIVYKDEDAARGQLVIPRGKLLRAQEIGILAAFGIEKATVTRQARVAIISSGDEIVPVNHEISIGKMHDVNSHTIAALCKSVGAIPTQHGIVRDDPGLLDEALARALPDNDVIVVSGGSSAGMRDHTASAFTSLPDSELLAHGVAIKPGKPFIFARTAGKCLLGLPGHVSSALVSARVFLLPLLARLQGRIEQEIQPSVPARLTRALASAQGRRDYIRCRLVKNPGASPEYDAVPLMAPSAVISGLVEADGLVVCPENSEGFAAGEVVQALLVS